METDDDDDLVVEANHFFTADGAPIFLTKDEEYTSIPDTQRDEDFILANDVALQEKSDDYQRGYMNALSAQ